MPEYLHPGVYIEEIERGPRPIEGVPTSTAALLGEAERGPISPRLVTSYKDYQRWFGDVFDDDKFLPYAANGFFENGGKRALRVPHRRRWRATTAGSVVGDFIVRAAGPGRVGNARLGRRSPTARRRTRTATASASACSSRIGAASVPGFDPFTDRTQRAASRYQEDFDDLVTDETSPDFYGKRIPFIDLDKAKRTRVRRARLSALLVRNAGVAAGTASCRRRRRLLAGGADDPAALGVDDFDGAWQAGREVEQGLAALELDSVPRRRARLRAGRRRPTSRKAIVDHCEQHAIPLRGDRRRPRGSTTRAASTRAARSTTRSTRRSTTRGSSPPIRGRARASSSPPGGHVLGVYARTDTERGVFKAPANEIVRGALDLEYDINDGTQDVLNPQRRQRRSAASRAAASASGARAR